jgi:hypothetical protein
MTSPTEPDAPEHPPPGVPAAPEPDNFPDGPLTADKVKALIPKIID